MMNPSAGSLDVVRAPLPSPVQAFTTTRLGGCSQAPFDHLNLGQHCGDDPKHVEENRRRLALELPSEPCWLHQRHGTRVIHLDRWQPGIEADAAWTDRPNQVAAILTADCLPVVVAHRSPDCLAVVHAGWRGLAAGILERTLDVLPVHAEGLQAWIGPCIGPQSYEVDETVRRAFGGFEAHFEPTRPGHWLADLPRIAIDRLQRLGVSAIMTSDRCSFSESAYFFSHRRDGVCGRMATVAWLG